MVMGMDCNLQRIYSVTSNTIRAIGSVRMRWAGHVACMWERGRAYRVLVGRPEGKRELGSSRRKWEVLLKCIFK